MLFYSFCIPNTKGKKVLKMKKILAKLFAFVVLALAMTPYVSAAQSINAEISPFTHKLVYTDFYNFATEYPVLLYKNITYIPMTSSMCNELYLSIAFTSEDGLYIARGGGRGNIGERAQVLGSIDYKNTADGRVTAVIPDYPVYINGRKYENAEYPCLNFRDITYLPLTYDIAVNEFDFDFAFDGDKKHIELAGNSWYSAPNFLSSNEEYIEIKDSRSVYSESTDENGYIKYTHEYDYDVYYRLNLKNDRVEMLPDGYVPPKHESTVSAKEPDPRFTVKDGYAYFEDIQLVKIPPSISGTGYHYSGYANAEIHDFGDASIIVVTTGVNIALPRGTTRKHHIFVKDENGIIKLDFNGRFSELFRGENGDLYIVSSSEESSYGNYFSEIYRYTKENGLERLSDRYENLNSLEYIGRRDGKIYVFGALRDGNREIAYSGESLNPMYSGYYVIDENLNITKISSFIGTRANVILAENGCLYAITNTSRNNKLVNLTTGEILISGI